MNLPELANYGVAVFSVGAIVYIVRIFVDFVKNHISHHTEVSQKLHDAVKELIRFLERTH